MCKTFEKNLKNFYNKYKNIRVILQKIVTNVKMNLIAIRLNLNILFENVKFFQYFY